MKTTLSSSKKTICLAIILAAASATSIKAQQYWDTNGATSGLGGTGNWDLATGNWNASTGTGVAAVWGNTNTSSAIFSGTAGTATISTTGITANTLSFGVTGYTIAGSATNTLTLAGSTPAIDVVSAGTATFSTGVLAGSAGLTKTGAGSLVIQSASTLSGAVNVNVGTLSLGTTTGTLTSATSVTVAQGATLQLNNTASNNNNNRLGNIDVTLNGGTLNFVGLEATSAPNATSESVNRVVLGSGASTLSLAGSVNASGSSLGTLTLGNVTSGISRSTGATLNFVDDADGDIISTVLATSNSLVGGWAVYTGTTASWITSSSGSLRELTTYLQNSDSTTWLTTSNVEATGDRSSINTRTINSLAIRSSTARTVTLNANQTLTLASGGLMATGVTGHIFTGGTVTSGTTAGAELFIYNNLGFTISSAIGNNAGGAVNVVKSGAGTLTLSGATTANTASGTFYVNEGTVTLAKTAATNAIAGNVIINGGTLGYTNANQIADTASVTLNSGTYNLGALAETISALSMTGGTLSRGGENLLLSNASSITGGTLGFSASGSAITTGSTLAFGGATFNYSSTTVLPTGGLVLGGNISYASTETGATTFNNTSTGFGRIDLGSSTRTFNIADSTTLASNTAEVSVNWRIGGTGGLTKSGTGVLALNGTNSYTGTTTVSGGTLLLGVVNALQTGTMAPNRTAVTLSGGTLSTGGFSQGAEGTGAATLGALTLSGNSGITLGSSAGNEVVSFSDLSTTLSSYTGILTIKNWEGTAGTAAGGDNIFFTLITGGDTTSSFSNIQFDIGGTLYAGQFTSVTGGFELYAGLTVVPEPSTYVGGGLVLGLAAWSQRKRLVELVKA